MSKSAGNLGPKSLVPPVLGLWLAHESRCPLAFFASLIIATIPVGSPPSIYPPKNLCMYFSAIPLLGSILSHTFDKAPSSSIASYFAGSTEEVVEVGSVLGLPQITFRVPAASGLFKK